jgi:hypothetical protein
MIRVFPAGMQKSARAKAISWIALVINIYSLKLTIEQSDV